MPNNTKTALIYFRLVFDELQLTRRFLFARFSSQLKMAWLGRGVVNMISELSARGSDATTIGSMKKNKSDQETIQPSWVISTKWH